LYWQASGFIILRILLKIRAWPEALFLIFSPFMIDFNIAAALRDLAIKCEQSDLETARDLMKLAQKKRPNGPVIRSKLQEYEVKLNTVSGDFARLRKLVQDGTIAIVPVGFRCDTAGKIREVLGVSQASFPFNTGFFSPYSITSVMEDPVIQLSSNDQGKTHRVCMKT